MRAIMLKCCAISQNFNDFVRGFFVIKKSVIFHVSSYNQYTTFAHPSIIKLKLSFFHSTLVYMLLKRVLCIYFRRTIKAVAEACGCLRVFASFIDNSNNCCLSVYTVCIVGARCASGWLL